MYFWIMAYLKGTGTKDRIFWVSEPQKHSSAHNLRIPNYEPSQIAQTVRSSKRHKLKF